MQSIAILLYRALDLYTWILIARILLSWLPSIDWYRQPARFLNDITDPVLRIFRGIIPPLGGLDLSPILLFVAIEIVKSLLLSVAAIVH
ncbi:MAG: YggT family protein [Candidatus Melainabacteria bacterium]